MSGLYRLHYSKLHLRDTSKIAYIYKEHPSLLKYYYFGEYLYALKFPAKWAQNHIDNSGPEKCNDCSYFGIWNGAFIGYCVNCAKNIYNGERGNGFVGYGKEMQPGENSESAYDTYLLGVDLNKIGDKEIFDCEKDYYNYAEKCKKYQEKNGYLEFLPYEKEFPEPYPDVYCISESECCTLDWFDSETGYNSY